MVKASSALLSAQQAILNALTQDTQLTSKVTGIYDRAPGSPTPPYIVLEVGDSVPFRTMSQDGETVSISLSVYSNTNGYDEAKEIMSHVERILINQSLSVQGYGDSVCVFVSSKTSYVDPNYQVAMKVSLNL